MQNVLLVNSNRFKQPWPVIPYGLCCVAAAAEAAGHQVRVLDLCFASQPGEEIRKAIDEFRPDVVGVTIRNIDTSVACNPMFLLEDVRDDVIRPLKAAFAGPIVVGGPAVGVSGPEILEFLDLEYGVQGDGEAAFVEWIRRIGAGASVAGLGGLIWRDKPGSIREQNPPLRVPNLDELPPARIHRYIDVAKYRQHCSAIQIQTKRGCPLSCSYCTYNAIEGLRYRLKDPQRIAEEIEEVVRETGIDAIEFTDSTFNLPAHHAKAVLRAILARGLKLKLRTMGLTPLGLDEELIELMKETGFREVDYGVESFSDAMLKSLGKSYSRADAIRGGALLRKHGIPTMWYFLLGAPGETRDTLRETFDTIHEHVSTWDLCNFAVGLRVYKASPIAREIERSHPGYSSDRFLTPTALPGDMALPLAEVKRATKRESLRRCNFLMYDEDETTPLLVMRLWAMLQERWIPDQPLWRAFIVQNRIKRLLGVRLIERLGFELSVRTGRSKVAGTRHQATA